MNSHLQPIKAMALTFGMALAGASHIQAQAWLSPLPPHLTWGVQSQDLLEDAASAQPSTAVAKAVTPAAYIVKDQKGGCRVVSAISLSPKKAQSIMHHYKDAKPIVMQKNEQVKMIYPDALKISGFESLWDMDDYFKADCGKSGRKKPAATFLL
jgi:hypothetical protein